MKQSAGSGVYRQSLKFVGRNPARLCGIIARTRFTAKVIGRQIHDDIMESHQTIGIAVYHVKGKNRLACGDDDAGLFQDLPFGRLLQCFPQEDVAPRVLPIGLAREVFTYGVHSSTLEVSGKVTGPCLDGWATLSTTEPIEIDGFQDCPVAGSLILSGNGDDVVVVFGAGGSVDIGDYHYNSCDDIDAVCP